MTIKAQITTVVDLDLLPVPTSAYYSQGGDNFRVEMRELPQDAVDALVAQWLEAVYAHKPNPWKYGTGPTVETVEGVFSQPLPEERVAPIMAASGAKHRDLFRDLEYLGQADAHADDGPLGEPAARSILEIGLYWLKRAAS